MVLEGSLTRGNHFLMRFPAWQPGKPLVKAIPFARRIAGNPQSAWQKPGISQAAEHRNLQCSDRHHPTFTRQKPGFCLSFWRVKSGRNALETQRTPGGSLAFYLVNVGFRARNNNMPVKQAPRVTDSSVGKITFKCNH